MKKTVSLILKSLTAITSIVGVALCLLGFELDGYSHWYKRLFYFTLQSNVWIGVFMVVLLVLALAKVNLSEKAQKRLYVVKFMFTVSIALTCIVFCSILGPFAGDDFRAWSLSSLLTHVFTPVFAIAEFFVDDMVVRLNFSHVALTTVPPLIYLIFAVVASAFGVDFGRGDTFAYFFLDFRSPAGLLGFVKTSPPQMGVIYWMICFLGLVIGVAFLLAKLHPSVARERREKRREARAQ